MLYLEEMNAISSHRPGWEWLFKYKLYHIPFWFLYNYIWWVVTIGDPVKAAHAMTYLPFAVKFSFYAIFQAAAVYFNLYLLIPRYLQKSKFVPYIFYLFITIFCTCTLIVSGYYLGAFLSGKSVQEAFGATSCLYQFYSNALPATLASTTFAMSIKLTKEWIRTEKRKQLLEKEKLETELNFLKYQFNPHFLFNTINSIFFLIHKNPDMASASLAKFSDLLRHQLYECNDGQIQLSKEIIHLENSVELERLRLNDNVMLYLDVEEEAAEFYGIAPFILMTFVENAFKHVSKQADMSNWIRIRLLFEEGRLDFSISNSRVHAPVPELLHYGGIGLKNVRRRLDLLYPGGYELDIRNGDEVFEIGLRLTLVRMPAIERTVSRAVDRAAGEPINQFVKRIQTEG